MTDELKLVLCGCGGKAEIVKRFSPDYDLDVYYAKCKNCGIETDDYFFESEAIVAWNIAVGRELERKKDKCTKINCPIQMNYISNDCDIKTCPYRTEHKNGKWKNIAFFTRECSECKAQFHELEYDNFCPNCGADMRGKE